MSLLERLRQDDFAEDLWQACLKDFEAGRMTFPEPLQFDDLKSKHLSPRFGIEQGFCILRFDFKHNRNSLLRISRAGLKVRPIDDFSASLINAATGVTEKLSYDTLDLFFELLRETALTCEARARLSFPQRKRGTGSVLFAQDHLMLIKADIDSAYRRVPVLPGVRFYRSG